MIVLLLRMGKITLLLVAVLCSASLSFAGKSENKRIGPCWKTLQGLVNVYKYTSTQTQFDGKNKETTTVSCYVRLTCISRYRVNNQNGHIFQMENYNIGVGGPLFDKAASDMAHEEMLDAEIQARKLDRAMGERFQYFQADNGAVGSVYHSKEEDAGIVNFKKKIVADCIPVSFKGTTSRKEADPTSAHKARYINDASMEGVTEQGTVKQTRIVDSNDVTDYSSHIEPDQIKSKSEATIEYVGGAPTKANGKSTFSFLPEVHVPRGKDVEVDTLEADIDAERRKRRQAYDEARRRGSTYDENSKMNHFEATGSFSFTRVRQEMVTKSKRDAVDFLSLPEVVESSLMAIINHTHEDLVHIMEMRTELGSITGALEELHNDIEHDKEGIAHTMQELLQLEANYGPPDGQTPAIESVLSYLNKLRTSKVPVDVEMRDRIYSIIAPEGSLQSQKALLEALEEETDDDEHLSVVMHIAFVHSPHPQFVAEIENRIGTNVHSNDALLLAYGCLISRASPELHQHMIQYLLKRLPEAELNEQSLVHHLHSLGNAGSPKSVEAIATYLEHPSTNVQLTTISALRFLLNDTLVQEALTDLLIQPDITEDHIDSIMGSIQYGLEHARENHIQKPFSRNLASALVLAATEHSEGQFDSSILDYLSAINTTESHKLVEILQSSPYSNGTRFRRGTNWAENNAVYNLVEPLRERQSDQRLYRYRKSYIFGKRFGVSDANIQAAAGLFMGVSDAGDYKLFDHTVLEANAFGRRYRSVDIKILRQKSESRTHSVLYVMVAGRTLKNINRWEPSSVCKTYTTGLMRRKSFHVFTLKHSIYIYVGVLNFKVSGHIELSNAAFIKFCENRGSATANAGLTPTFTFKIKAGASANILGLVKGNIDVKAEFNYVISPEVSTKICYKYGRVRVQNCCGIYNQWKDNKVHLKTTYQTRQFCWGTCWSKKKTWKQGSNSWKIRGTRKTPLWEKCDQRVRC